MKNLVEKNLSYVQNQECFTHTSNDGIIFFSEKLNNCYYLGNLAFSAFWRELEKPINVESIEKEMLANPEFDKIIKILIEQKFIVTTNLSGKNFILKPFVGIEFNVKNFPESPLNESLIAFAGCGGASDY